MTLEDGLRGGAGGVVLLGRKVEEDVDALEEHVECPVVQRFERGCHTIHAWVDPRPVAGPLIVEPADAPAKAEQALDEVDADEPCSPVTSAVPTGASLSAVRRPL